MAINMRVERKLLALGDLSPNRKNDPKSKKFPLSMELICADKVMLPGVRCVERLAQKYLECDACVEKLDPFIFVIHVPKKVKRELRAAFLGAVAERSRYKN